jgi:hypothetical protein
MVFGPQFPARALEEFRASGLDFMFPFSTIDYLDDPQSQAVIAGTLDPVHGRSIRTLMPHPGGAPGGMGLVRADFLRSHGGMIDGFRGWGHEDLAWLHKVATLGRIGATRRDDQRAWHLFHPDSGSHSSDAHRLAARNNPHFGSNRARLDHICSVSCPAAFARDFPPVTVRPPWPDGSCIIFVATKGRAMRQARTWAAQLERAFGSGPIIVPADAEPLAATLRTRGARIAVAFGDTLAACAATAALAPTEAWLLVPASITDDGGPDNPDQRNAMVLAGQAGQMELLRQRGLNIWHRPWDSGGASANDMPVILQPLSHLLGRPRNWRIRITLDRRAVSPTALDRPPFWYIGCHDAQGTEVMRSDASFAELRAIFARGGDHIVIEREIRAVRPPDRWTVWTLDRRRTWLDNLSGPVETA